MLERTVIWLAAGTTRTTAVRWHAEVGTVDGYAGPAEREGKTRHETQLERLDRNLEEMTGELRVVVTGVQVLFAFLFIVPFDTGFAHVGNFERTVYFITLILAALAAVHDHALRGAPLPIPPRRQAVPRVQLNRVVIAGLAFLALAMCGCLLLVTTKLFGVTAGVVTAVLGAIPFAVLWFAVPMRRLRRLDGTEREPSPR